MGNASAKEERRPSPAFPRTLSGGRSGSSAQPSPGAGSSSSSHPYGPFSPDATLMHAERARFSGQREFAHLLGMPSHAVGIGDRDDAANMERRRETRAEREQKRLERERINRERERERSMREESVDGGYLVTQGVYTGIEDFSKPVVRQLMIERRLAPFWKGLNDHSESWAEHQLVAAARGLPIPAADEAPQSPDVQRRASHEDTHEQLSEQTMKNLTVPIQARSTSTQSEVSHVSTSTPAPAAPISASPPPSSGSLLRGRAKTLATLTTSARAMPSADMQPREMHLPKDPYVNGQPVEAYLYKDASECPICFLYYPPYLNRTRCCDQPICSECFVQIKRPDPHPPEHPDPNDPQHANEQAQEQDGQLVSEPSQCPYCAQPEFGITYEAVPFRRGLTYVNQQASAGLPGSAAMSSSSSLASNGQLSPSGPNRRRAGSLAVNAPQVISTDRVRPDWATKLASARAHQARRSAAATALHTAAYLMNGRNGSDSRGFPGFGRRVMMRRGTGDSGSGSGPGYSLPPHMVGFGLERHRSEGEDSQSDAAAETSPTITGPPRHSSRRSRVDDLEEMMMMEAIRLSLASEEERRKKEEKDARKDAKKRAKEEKKADKAARKAGTGPYAIGSSGPSRSSGSLGTPSSASLSIDTGNGSGSGKGKAIARHESSPGDTESETGQLSRSAPQDVRAQSHLERSRAEFISSGAGVGVAGSVPYRPSHLRNLSNVSSDASSVADSTDASPGGGVFPLSAGPMTGETSHATGGGADDSGLESMFNFRSLAAMIDVGDEDAGGERSPSGDGIVDGDSNASQRAEHFDEKHGHRHSHLENASLAASGEHNEAAPAKQSFDSGSTSDVGDSAMTQSVATLTPENVRTASAALKEGVDTADGEGSAVGAAATHP